MYLKSLADYESMIVDGTVAILRGVDVAPLDRIEAFLSAPITAVRDHSDRPGCLLCNTSADCASLDDDKAARVRRNWPYRS